MTRSLFVVEDVGNGYVHYRSRYRDELGDGLPGTVIVEYVPRPRWIPVGERLPGERVEVLGWTGDEARVFEMVLMNGHVEWWDAECIDHDVTHWMPLPEGPEIPPVSA